jgi:hypothetical protein
MSPEKAQSDLEALASDQRGESPSKNGASSQTNGKLRPLWEGPIHFVMRSAEATMVLPPEQPVPTVDELVVRKDSEASK